MALITIPLVIQMSSLTQTEENTLASTLTGQDDGASTIWNNTLVTIRRWNGTAFEDTPEIPIPLIPLIPNSKLEDMAANTIKGNNTGSPGVTLNLTVAETKSLLVLENVTNESKATMFASPTFTGTVILPDDTVSFAKMQNISTSRILGRSTASTGDIEELTLGANMTLVAGVLNSLLGATAWGTITGTLSAQTDLQAALDAKQTLDTQLTSLVALSYVSNALKVVRVNSAETGFELSTPSGGSFTITETEIDFGSVPLKMKRFTITDAAVTASHKILVTLSYNDPSDGDTDSAEWFENMTVMAKAGTGQFFLYANSPYQDLNGKVKVNYTFA